MEAGLAEAVRRSYQHNDAHQVCNREGQYNQALTVASAWLLVPAPHLEGGRTLRDAGRGIPLLTPGVA